MSDFLNGAAFLAFLAVAGYFLRFWTDIGDRFLLWFALAFGLFAANRVLALALPSENQLPVYVVRLVGFAVIVLAVVDRNLDRPRAEPRDGDGKG